MGHNPCLGMCCLSDLCDCTVFLPCSCLAACLSSVVLFSKCIAFALVVVVVLFFIILLLVLAPLLVYFQVYHVERGILFCISGIGFTKLVMFPLMVFMPIGGLAWFLVIKDLK